MELIDVTVTAKKSLTLPFEEIQIMPIGDVQLGSEGVQINRLKDQINWAMDQGNVYFLGMGDYIDVMSPSNRSSWAAMKKYDSVVGAMERSARQLAADFLGLVEKTKDRWFGLLEGHHFYEFEDGTTSDTVITQALGSTFLGTCAFIRTQFKTGGNKQFATIWCHHGSGNGIYPHSPLNKLYHVVNFFEADIYFIGHQTKKPAVKMPKIFMRENGTMGVKNRVLVGTGGFTQGYIPGSKSGSKNARGGYVEQKLLSPVYLGSPLVKVRPVHTSTYNRLDLNVEI